MLKPTINPYEVWLSKTQKLLRDVAFWVKHGQSETAVKAIDDYWDEWRNTPST